MTKDEKIEVVHGSGNVFRDVGFPNPDVEQAKAILSEIFFEMKIFSV